MTEVTEHIEIKEEISDNDNGDYDAEEWYVVPEEGNEVIWIQIDN